MKILRKQEYKTKAEKLANYIEKRKELEKLEKDLKGEFKILMAESAVLKVGDYILTLTDKIRSSLDKKALIEKCGKDFVNAFEKVSSYKQFDIKKA